MGELPKNPENLPPTPDELPKNLKNLPPTPDELLHTPNAPFRATKTGTLRRCAGLKSFLQNPSLLRRAKNPDAALHFPTLNDRSE
ncbi:MAG TPA: hypothetical protein VL728_17530 [Cyclobacteriaceae bacterium]|nr:hypothetical protein [Cyclobacteriaceae bacterium]